VRFLVRHLTTSSTLWLLAVPVALSVVVVLAVC
jgi:hypothetical protein